MLSFCQAAVEGEEGQAGEDLFFLEQGEGLVIQNTRVGLHFQYRTRTVVLQSRNYPQDQ